MAKNSFTENFSNCVNGFPVVSVAAHIVLHEGLIGDALKLGALGLGAYGLYNGINGDQNIFGNTIKNAGETAGKFISGLGGGNETLSKIGGAIQSGMGTAGDALNSGLQKGREWVQDTGIGRSFDLGGQTAARRQEIKAGVDEFNRVAGAARQNQINSVFQQHLTPEETNKKVDEINAQFDNDARTYGEKRWNESSRNNHTLPIQPSKPDDRGSITPPANQPANGAPSPNAGESGQALRNAARVAAGQFNKSLQRPRQSGGAVYKAPQSAAKPSPINKMPSAPTSTGRDQVSK